MTGRNPPMQTATAMVVLSLPRDANVKIVAAEIDTSRGLNLVGQVQGITIGKETLVVFKVAYRARAANKSMIVRTLNRIYPDDQVVHVTTTDVERHDG